MSHGVILIAFVCLTACASLQTAKNDHQTGKINKLTCSEFNSSLEACQLKAKALCKGDYKLIDTHTEVAPDAGDGFYVYTKYHLLIEC
jgi:hypothetical protein